MTCRVRSRSIPCAFANTSASDTPRLFSATAIWFASLQACPAPWSPMWTIVFPSASKTGIARFTSFSSPPIMIERRASIAPSSPPETGASSVRNSGRFAAARFANSRVAAGEIVLMSIASKPSCAPAAMPSGPKVTVSTSGELVTMVMTMSLRSATSRGVRMTVAPASPSGFARSRVRFVTVTAKPALGALRASGAPMIPRPTNPGRSTALVRPFAAVDEEGPLLGLVDVHRRDQEIVGDVDEALGASQLVRDRLRERVFFICVEEERPRLLHECEELGGLEVLFVREEDGRPEIFVAVVDLVIEHRVEPKPIHLRSPMHEAPKTVPASVRHTIRREPGSTVVIEAQIDAGRLARPAQPGDIVTVDVDATIPDRKVPPFARNAHVEAGKPLGIAGLGEALVGLKAGETKSVELKFPDDASEGELRGRAATFSFRPSQVSEKVLPALDDEFAKTVGVSDLAALRKAVRNELAHAAFHESRDDAAEKAVAHALESATVELPEVLVQEELEHLVADLKARVKEQGLTFEQFLLQARKTEDELRKEWLPLAERRAKSLLVLDEIARKEDVKVTGNELAEQAALSPLAQADPQAFRSPAVLAALARSIRNRKTVDKLIGLDSPDAEREAIRKAGGEVEEEPKKPEIIVPAKTDATVEGREAIRALLEKK